MDQLKQLQEKLEGPRLIRYAGALCGVLMCGAALYSMADVVNQLGNHPNAVIVKSYSVITSLAIVCIELKSVAQLKATREFCYRWMPFLGIMAGKGVFYIFAGCLSLAFIHDMLLLAPGLVVAAIGVLYILMHFGQFRSLGQAIEEQEQLNSNSLHREPYYVKA